VPSIPPEQVPDADAALVHGQQPPSARVPLSRERIVATAVAFIDAHGLVDLSMRRLGTELGVEAMSLYRYVTGREELLDAVVEHLVAELAEDTEVVREPTHGWQDFTQRLAHGIRRIALAHPNAFPLIASRPGQAPWLRPPLRSLEWVELFLAALVAQGFTRGGAVAAYRAFTSFLLGHLLLESSQAGADIGPLDVVGDTDVDTSADQDDLAAEHPLLAELRPALSEDHAAVEFEESLENLLERLQRLR